MLSVPHSPEPLRWFKSSYSGANTTECVEAAHLPQATAVRDSKAPDGPMLTFGNASWEGFLTAIQHQQLGA
ncbi:DUF397 domain-containing protein [Streptomyces sp. NBC_01224]|uniref:DUF397 domain-containing protein n=1 Tax=Streptomyces sp. NBC_01224 TaxID=2903783 RepID=UPI002E15B0B8|nr:DUF397 domain-containing protein [Streptomyces sp. NBC_01224]